MKKLLVVLVVMVAVLAAGVAMAGITNTKHDLSSNSSGANLKSAQTTEICVFCHTPHSSVVGTSSAPLWNKTYVSNVIFTPYGNTVRGTATMTTMSTATKTCLACHDGTQGMGANLNNAPGSGNSALADFGKVNGVALLNGNFTDDHPMGVVYIVANGLRAVSGASYVNGIVKTNAVNSVYATSGTDTVECSSCHSVHNEGGSTGLFMPYATGNQNSQLCITCHPK